MNIVNIFKNYGHLIILLLLIVTCESTAQTILEKSALTTAKKDNKKIIFMVGGIILYALVGFLYYQALTSRIPLGILNTIWQASTIIIITLISAFYFKQKLSTKQIIGIVIVAIGSLFFAPEHQAAIGGRAIGGSDGKINTMEDLERLRRAVKLQNVKKDFFKLD